MVARSLARREKRAGNYQLMNPHIPMTSFVMQSNTDSSPVVTRHQSEMYCCKYCSKHGKRKGQASVLYEVLDDMTSKDTSAKEKFGDDYDKSKLGSKLHRAFMGEIGEEMSQAEVGHHANKAPEYLCSRPEKYVHFYKKALAISRPARGRHCETEAPPDTWPSGEDWGGLGDNHVGGVSTQRSDIDLYESRTQYSFWPAGTALSSSLPPNTTPEAQVAAV